MPAKDSGEKKNHLNWKPSCPLSKNASPHIRGKLHHPLTTGARKGELRKMKGAYGKRKHPNWGW